MPDILDNDYVENIQRGGRGGRGGQGGGPGGSYPGAAGFGGYGYAGSPGGYGSTPTVRRFTVPGAAGPIPVHSLTSSLTPKSLNRAAPTDYSGNFGGLRDIIGRLQEQQAGGSGYSQENEMEKFLRDGNPQGLMSWLLQRYQAANNYGPDGSSAVMGSMQDNAARAGNQARQRAQLAADVSGLDPAAAAALRLRTDVGSNTDANTLMSQALMQQLLSRQGFGDQLLMDELNHLRGWQRADQGAALDRRSIDQQRGGGLGSFIGQIGGALLPSILPGLGGLFGGGGSTGGGGSPGYYAGGGGFTGNIGGARRPAIPAMPF